MQIAFVIAGLKLNIIIQKKCQKMHVLCIMLAKTSGIRYFNVETCMFFAPSYSKFLAKRLHGPL